MGANKTLTFNWNTIGVATGNYKISALASIVPDELNTDNNNFIDWTIQVRIPGDVNGDRTVDILDISTLSAHWYPGPPAGPSGYNSSSDINNDGAIDILDVAIVSANWGRTET